jgi:hypothetical protein
VHAGGRRKGKGRSRILYWFRTPPGVRVGRAALDEEAIRLIEDHNPDVEFDWTRILKEQSSETRPGPSKDRDFRAERIAKRRARAAGKAEPSEVVEMAEPPEFAEMAESADMTESSEVAELVDGVDEIPSPVEETEDGAVVDDALADGQPLRPSQARLGSEGLARLRARYAEVLARISERVPDPARQDELKAQAERLNPDGWVTDSEVTAGLEEYESVFEALRAAVGGPSRRRRRRRRMGGGREAVAPAGAVDEVAGGDPWDDRPADEDPDKDP